MRRIIHIFITVLTVALMMVGCSTDNNSATNNHSDKLGIRGIVMEISVDGANASILVEGNLEEDTTYDKAVIEITKDTMIQKDSMSRLFEISDIEKGSTVEVIFKGGVKESYPVQGTADIVRIITQ